MLSVAVILISIHWVLLPIVLIINIPALFLGIGFSQVKYNLSGFRIPEAKKAAKKLATKSSGASASKTGKKKPAKP
jgi:hypothetical protein